MRYENKMTFFEFFAEHGVDFLCGALCGFGAILVALIAVVLVRTLAFRPKIGRAHV